MYVRAPPEPPTVMTEVTGLAEEAVDDWANAVVARATRPKTLYESMAKIEESVEKR